MSLKKFYRTAINSITLLLFALLQVTGIAGANEDGKIGLSVIKDMNNPIQYIHPRFASNPLASMNLSNYDGEQNITDYLSAMSVGKQVVDYLIDYQYGRTDSKRLYERMPEAARQSPTHEDLRAGIINNYILVVKMDARSQEKALLGDTVNFKPTGAWYLYRVECDEEVFEKLKQSTILPSDNEQTKGKKRVQYERVDVPIRLMTTGTNIDRNLYNYINKIIKYISADDLRRNSESPRPGKTNKALKAMLSPILILKN